ncbi:multicopper oxidase domain-containing protein [Chitinophaga sp. CC14]|uniref:multicopper oxidase domain-containing protein n=1 Tax=Chitinophaga sp. CC14 TaxID=3029199 RepID=UPI003B784528
MKHLSLLMIVLLPLTIFAQQHGNHVPAGHDMPGMKMTPANGKGIVEYDLYINDTIVNFSGNKSRHAMAINGQIPAPTLYFTEGDTAVIRVHNLMHHETSLHWHGLLLPNKEDGVPYLTTAPVLPGTTYTFTFPLKQSGTYWYHSHTMLQEQIGIYGPIVIQPRQKIFDADKDVVLLFSDWTNEKPGEVLKTLRRNDPANEWYAIKKKYPQSLDKLIQHHSWGERVKSSFKRMPPMDMSDVYYDKFLFAGNPRLDLSKYKPGEKLRLRIINGSSSSYFYLQYAGGKMELISADGTDVQPVKIDRILIGVAETYDFMITVPSSGTYELRATSQDVAGYASAFIGKGDTTYAPAIPRPNVWKMDTMMMDMSVNFPGKMGHNMKGMKMDNMDHGNMDMEDMKMDKDSSKMNMEDMPGMDMGKKNMDTAMQMDMLPDTIPGKKMKKAPAHDMKNMRHDDMKMDKDMNHMKGMKHVKDTGHTKKMKMDDMPGMKKDKEKKDTSRSMDMDSMPGMNMQPDTSQDMDHMAHSMQGADKSGFVMFNYDMLKARNKTSFDKNRPVRKVNLQLTGNMYRYVWSINNKMLSEADKILIKKGEVVQFIIENTTMMNHPMHLHGHFFRVLNKNGDFSPFKHTLDMPPMSTITIEFAADEDKDWFFHCHILYHMMSGMSRIVHYEGSARDTALAPFPLKKLLNEEKMWFLYGSVAAKSHMSELQANYINARNAVRAEVNANYNGQYEANLSYERYIGDWFRPYIGFSTVRQKYYNVFTGKQTFEQDFDLPVLGVRYTLPFFIDADLRVNAKGRVRLELDGEQWLLPRMFFNWRINTDQEYHLDLEYLLAKKVSLSGGYDSRYKWGGGLLVRF